MDLANRILKNGLEIVDEALYSFCGDPLLVIKTAGDKKNDCKEIAKMSIFTQTTNVEGELHTSLHFGDVSSEVMSDENTHLYYVLFEGKRIDLSYFLYGDGEIYKNHNNRIIELVLDEILGEYEWLDLKGSKGKDSCIYYLHSSQVEQVDGCLHIKSSHPLAYRVSLEKIL